MVKHFVRVLSAGGYSIDLWLCSSPFTLLLHSNLPPASRMNPSRIKRASSSIEGIEPKYFSISILLLLSKNPVFLLVLLFKREVLLINREIHSLLSNFSPLKPNSFSSKGSFLFTLLTACVAHDFPEVCEK